MKSRLLVLGVNRQNERIASILLKINYSESHLYLKLYREHRTPRGMRCTKPSNMGHHLELYINAQRMVDVISLAKAFNIETKLLGSRSEQKTKLPFS